VISKKVIDLSSKRKINTDPELAAMMHFSDGIDSIVTEELNKAVIEPQNIVAVLSHRLGSLIAALPFEESQKEDLLNHSLELILKLSLSRTH